MTERDDTDPHDELIRDGPPELAEAVAEFVDGYMMAMSAIEQVFAKDPLRAAQETLRATMRLLAGLSPPGSPGPGSLILNMLLASVLEVREGAPPSLLRHATLRRNGRPIRPN